MQSYTESAQKGNIFEQFSAWRSGRSESMTNSKINKIVSLRNDNSHSDEAIIVIRIMLFIVTAFTVYCGFLFYQNTFGKVFSPTATFLASVGLAIITELAKIYLTHRALRSIFFGWIFRSFWTLGGWLFIFALGTGAFVWSINISTDGMNMLTREVTEKTTAKDDLSGNIAAATADIDRQIATLSAGQSEAMATRWKGTTTRDAQRLANMSAKSIQTLQEQRKTVVDQITADHRDANSTRSANISNWAYWIDSYGGYMEAVAAICLLAIVFFERRLVDEYRREHGGNMPNPTPSKGSFRTDHTTGAPQHNGATAGPSRSGLFSNNFISPDPSVRNDRTLSESPAGSAGNSDADFIKFRLKRLKGWDDNFNDKKNKPETVAQNMYQLLNEIGKRMQDEHFAPDPDTANQLIQYCVETGFPAMDAAGYPYKYQNDFLALASRYTGASMRA